MPALSPCLVSFVIPVFNPGRYLDEAINSILTQENFDEPHEILLIDDRSTDPLTLQSLDTYSKNPKIRVFHQERNGGPAAARNRGIAESRGEWISFLDADDLLLPNSMSRRVTSIRNDPAIRWIAGDLLEMPIEGTMTNPAHYTSLPQGCPEVQPGVFKLERPTHRLIHHVYPPLFGSMMVRKDLLDQTGPLNATLTYGEDNLFGWTAGCYADLYWIEEPLFCLRRHHESLTKNKLRMAKEQYKAGESAFNDPRFKFVRKDLRWHISGILRIATGFYLEEGLSGKALASAIRALRWAPNDTRNYALTFEAARSFLPFKNTNS